MVALAYLTFAHNGIDGEGAVVTAPEPGRWRAPRTALYFSR